MSHQNKQITILWIVQYEYLNIIDHYCWSFIIAFTTGYNYNLSALPHNKSKNNCFCEHYRKVLISFQDPSRSFNLLHWSQLASHFSAIYGFKIFINVGTSNGHPLPQEEQYTLILGLVWGDVLDKRPFLNNRLLNWDYSTDP